METYIAIYLACWFWCTFEPIQDFINWIISKIPMTVYDAGSKRHHYIVDTIWTAIGCQYCITLWTTLIITHNIPIALAMSLLAQLHSKLIK